MKGGIVNYDHNKELVRYLEGQRKTWFWTWVLTTIMAVVLAGVSASTYSNLTDRIRAFEVALEREHAKVVKLESAILAVPPGDYFDAEGNSVFFGRGGANGEATVTFFHWFGEPADAAPDLPEPKDTGLEDSATSPI